MKLTCKSCGHILSPDKQVKLYHPDIIKLYKIQKKNKLSNTKIMKILGISKQTYYRWFNPDGYLKPIKQIYFDILILKGYA